MTHSEEKTDFKNKPIKIFLSYAWANQTSSDIIEEDLSKIGISIIRDKNEIQYKDSLERFMNRVRSSDFVIILLSKEYLESRNCLYELFELFKEKDHKKLILPIVINNIKFFNSSDRLNFIQFWENKKKELDDNLNKVNVLNSPSLLEELRFVNQICLQLDIYLCMLADMKHLNLDQMRSEGYYSLLQKIGFSNITYLVELLEIALIEDLKTREIALDEYFHKYPPNAYSLAIRAELASKQGNYEKAKLNYLRSLELEPMNSIALNNLGYLFDSKLEDYKNAKVYYEKAIEIDPDFIVAKLNLGPILSHHYNDTDTPKRFYEEIIKDDPTEERAYNNLANIYSGKGEYNLAKELLEKALSLKPDFFNALINYAGLMHVHFNDKETALVLYKKAKKVAYNEHAKAAAQLLINQIEKTKEEFLKSIKSSIKKRGRNSLCPCGSGQKFKYCHGKND